MPSAASFDVFDDQYQSSIGLSLNIVALAKPMMVNDCRSSIIPTELKTNTIFVALQCTIQ